MKEVLNGWFEKQVKNMRKKPYFYIVSTIVIFLLMAYFFSFIQPDSYGKGGIDRFFVTVRFLFVNEHNRLNWVSISAIGVMVSYAINSKFNRDKLRAELVSSSRMKWLDNIKLVSAEFIKDVNMFNAQYIVYLEKVKIFNEKREVLSKTTSEYDLMKMIMVNNKIDKATELGFEILARNMELSKLNFSRANDEAIDLNDSLNILQDRIIKNSLIIRMNFSDNEENNEIVRKCEGITNDIRDFVSAHGYAQKSDDLMGNIEESKIRNQKHYKILESLTLLLRDYYKKEWEKVKKGK